MTRGRGVPPPVMVDDTGGDGPEAPRLMPPASKAERTAQAIHLNAALRLASWGLRRAWETTRPATAKRGGRRGKPAAAVVAPLKERAVELLWLYVESEVAPDPHLWWTIREMLDVRPGQPGSLLRRASSNKHTRGALDALAKEDAASGGRLSAERLHDLTGVGDSVVRDLLADPDYPVKRARTKK